MTVNRLCPHAVQEKMVRLAAGMPHASQQLGEEHLHNSNGSDDDAQYVPWKASHEMMSTVSGQARSYENCSLQDLPGRVVNRLLAAANVRQDRFTGFGQHSARLQVNCSDDLPARLSAPSA